MNEASILYVDDEEINLRLFRNTFRRSYKIFTAISADEGLNILGRNIIDLVITDQRMPHITGVEFLKKIQEIYPEIPPGRLIVSGYSEPEDIKLAFEKYQLFKFISKPWDKEELNQIIKQALEHE